MTYKIEKCKICGQSYRAQTYDLAELLSNHIRQSHPIIYDRLREINKQVEKLQDEANKFDVGIRDLIYYHRER